MASTINISLASRAYDGTLPILRGQMQFPGFEFDITETEDVPACSPACSKDSMTFAKCRSAN